IAGGAESKRIRRDVHDAAALRLRELDVSQDVGDAVFDLGLVQPAGLRRDDAAVIVDGEARVDRARQRRLHDELLLVAVLDLIQLLPHVAANRVLFETADRGRVADRHRRLLGHAAAQTTRAGPDAVAGARARAVA